MYLKPQEMLRWSFRQAQETAGWTGDEIASATPIMEARSSWHSMCERINRSFIA